MKYLVTVIDAIHDGFGWTANGSYVERHEIDNSQDAWPTHASLWREVRRVSGYTGARGRWLDDCTWMPYNSVIMIHLSEIHE